MLIDFNSAGACRLPVYFLIDCGDSMRGDPSMAAEPSTITSTLDVIGVAN